MAGMTVSEAAAAIGAGAVAVIPTDTVYGLAARAEVAAAIFALKNRPREKALPVLGATVAQLEPVAEIDGVARALAETEWPGPLTLVLRRREGFTADLGGADPTTVAVRIPAHPVALELLEHTGPLAVTSANVSGRPPATTHEEACALVPEAVCLDGGTCDGVPSTVLRLVDEPEVLREGALAAADLLERVRTLSRGS